VATKRINKFCYLVVVQSFVAGAWLDLSAENKAITGYRGRARGIMRDYVKNEGGIYRIVSRKIPNPDYTFKGAL
jgi:hypothetical protein